MYHLGNNQQQHSQNFPGNASESLHNQSMYNATQNTPQHMPSNSSRTSQLRQWRRQTHKTLPANIPTTAASACQYTPQSNAISPQIQTISDTKTSCNINETITPVPLRTNYNTCPVVKYTQSKIDPVQKDAVVYNNEPVMISPSQYNLPQEASNMIHNNSHQYERTYHGAYYYGTSNKHTAMQFSSTHSQHMYPHNNLERYPVPRNDCVGYKGDQYTNEAMFRPENYDFKYTGMSNFRNPIASNWSPQYCDYRGNIMPPNSAYAMGPYSHYINQSRVNNVRQYYGNTNDMNYMPETIAVKPFCEEPLKTNQMPAYGSFGVPYNSKLSNCYWDQNTKNIQSTLMSDKYPFHGIGPNEARIEPIPYYYESCPQNSFNLVSPNKNQGMYQNNCLNKFVPYWEGNSTNKEAEQRNPVDFVCSQNVNNPNSKCQNIKDFLESWSDKDCEESNTTNLPDVVLSNTVFKNDKLQDSNETLYVLETINVSKEFAQDHYKHLPQIDKLPDNIKILENIEINKENSQNEITNLENLEKNKTSDSVVSKCNNMDVNANQFLENNKIAKENNNDQKHTTETSFIKEKVVDKNDIINPELVVHCEKKLSNRGYDKTIDENSNSEEIDVCVFNDAIDTKITSHIKKSEPQETSVISNASVGVQQNKNNVSDTMQTFSDIQMKRNDSVIKSNYNIKNYNIEIITNESVKCQNKNSTNVVPTLTSIIKANENKSNKNLTETESKVSKEKQSDENILKFESEVIKKHIPIVETLNESYKEKTEINKSNNTEDEIPESTSENKIETIRIRKQLSVSDDSSNDENISVGNDDAYIDIETDSLKVIKEPDINSELEITIPVKSPGNFEMKSNIDILDSNSKLDIVESKLNTTCDKITESVNETDSIELCGLKDDIKLKPAPEEKNNTEAVKNTVSSDLESNSEKETVIKLNTSTTTNDSVNSFQANVKDNIIYESVITNNEKNIHSKKVFPHFDTNGPSKEKIARLEIQENNTDVNDYNRNTESLDLNDKECVQDAKELSENNFDESKDDEIKNHPDKDKVNLGSVKSIDGEENVMKFSKDSLEILLKNDEKNNTEKFSYDELKSPGFDSNCSSRSMPELSCYDSSNLDDETNSESMDEIPQLECNIFNEVELKNVEVPNKESKEIVVDSEDVNENKVKDFSGKLFNALKDEKEILNLKNEKDVFSNFNESEKINEIIDEEKKILEDEIVIKKSTNEDRLEPEIEKLTSHELTSNQNNIINIIVPSEIPENIDAVNDTDNLNVFYVNGLVFVIPQIDVLSDTDLNIETNISTCDEETNSQHLKLTVNDVILPENIIECETSEVIIDNNQLNNNNAVSEDVVVSSTSDINVKSEFLHSYNNVEKILDENEIQNNSLDNWFYTEEIVQCSEEKTTKRKRVKYRFKNLHSTPKIRNKKIIHLKNRVKRSFKNLKDEAVQVDTLNPNTNDLLVDKSENICRIDENEDKCKQSEETAPKKELRMDVNENVKNLSNLNIKLDLQLKNDKSQINNNSVCDNNKQYFIETENNNAEIEYKEKEDCIITESPPVKMKRKSFSDILESIDNTYLIKQKLTSKYKIPKRVNDLTKKPNEEMVSSATSSKIDTHKNKIKVINEKKNSDINNKNLIECKCNELNNLKSIDNNNSLKMIIKTNHRGNSSQVESKSNNLKLTLKNSNTGTYSIIDSVPNRERFKHYKEKVRRDFYKKIDKTRHGIYKRSKKIIAEIEEKKVMQLNEKDLFSVKDLPNNRFLLKTKPERRYQVPKMIIKKSPVNNNYASEFSDNILNNAFRWQPIVRLERNRKLDKMAEVLPRDEQKIVLQFNRVSASDYSLKCRIKLQNYMRNLSQFGEKHKD